MIRINLKKITNKKENIYKKHLLWLVRLINELYFWSYKKAVGEVKDQVMSLFKTKNYSKPELVKTVHGSEKKKKKNNHKKM